MICMTGLLKTLSAIVRKYWLYAVLLILWLLSLWLMRADAESMRQEKERLSVELAHVQIAPPIVHDTIRDTVPVSTAPVIVTERATYRKDIADKRLLRDINVSSGQVETQQVSGVRYSDSVTLSRKGRWDYQYADSWTRIDLHFNPPDTTLTYSVRDSLTTIVYREYKHRFLWWRWGTKGYKVKVVNFNPHATILYNQYIKVE